MFFGYLLQLTAREHFPLSELLVEGFVDHWFRKINFHSHITMFKLSINLRATYSCVVVEHGHLYKTRLAYSYSSQWMLKDRFIHGEFLACKIFAPRNPVSFITISHIHLLNIKADLRIITYSLLLCVYRFYDVLIPVNLYLSVLYFSNIHRNCERFVYIYIYIYIYNLLDPSTRAGSYTRSTLSRV